MSTKDDKPKKTKAAAKTPKSKKPQSMAELLKQVDQAIVVPHKDERITGTIVEKQKNALIIDINAKTLASVGSREFEIAQDYIDELKEGQKIEVTVVSEDSSRGGYIPVSLRQAAVDAKWEIFEESLEGDSELTARGIETNKGGMIVEVSGVRGFVPSSQFGKDFMGRINDLLNKDFQVKAIEVDREKNRLIFSERHVSEADELALRDSALTAVESGAVYEGIVSGVMHFGLFVTVEIPVGSKKDSIGHIEGLVHISEISWEKVDHPKNYHHVGDRLKVKVLGVDEKTNKLNLSVKQLSDDPWKEIDKGYPVGTTLTGTVTRVEPFGVFVNVEDGVDGLIHASKLSPDVVYEKGIEVTITVESVDPERRRMSLSPILTEVPVGYK
ncbi:MAG: S1 RNA-binding domain-containing protein [Candidatus Pacebacteria bacterium]|jgi:small subunit ribosomal protein S1|nr:S1 RNA-binding domain-containing protein [Candidatus Paceibacterota bacterium]MBT3511821.1 S1 RNA-binding domain-containing protein [Candidatus Paceibacterota bacterium]MBT4004613.1 S1 RNA-binding domain-containing protein [Candidatus Paceibacterota bacterium]MBT4358341.1 S1 RNA-binding domain-containing protein [Candidatus Paceibacterota bacterium]MBT4681389.1 S1 RNA-binding domain-containing protein [Candidatus Paceibacterota bacterium]